MDYLDLFEDSLRRYGHLMAEAPDPASARRIEGAQLEIMQEVAGDVDVSKPLDEVLEALISRGFLEEAVRRIAAAMGDSPPDAAAAYQSLRSGDLEDRGAQAALLAIQAFARAYAEKYESKNGAVEWRGGSCPLCGTESRAMIRENGDYYMVCPLCGYKWLVSKGRPTCPRCGEEERLGVYTDRRGVVGLAACQGCGHTWYIVMDELEVPRMLIPLIATGAERFRRALPEGGPWEGAQGSRG